MKYLSQRLQSEKSLLQETLQTVEQDIENSKSRLQTTLQEISSIFLIIMFIIYLFTYLIIELFD